jgi:antitoxin MazE
MDAIIRKWGNSPAVRLTSSTMKTAAFSLEQQVTIKATKGRIVIEPADQTEFNLESLVSGISKDNCHEEVDFGGPVGRESL